MDADRITLTQPNGVDLDLYPVEVREPEPWEDPDNSPSWPATCGCDADISGDPVFLPLGWPAEIPDGTYASWIVDDYTGIILAGLPGGPVVASCRACADQVVIEELLGEIG